MLMTDLVGLMMTSRFEHEQTIGISREIGAVYEL